MKLRGQNREARAAADKGLPHVDSYTSLGNTVEAADLYVALGSDSRPGVACGMLPPLTRMVATPCYRAPEVGLQ